MRALIEFQPTNLDERIGRLIFAKGAGIPDAALLEPLLFHRAATVRRLILPIAERDGMLTIEAALRLLNDGEADIRSRALRFLIRAGQVFSLSDVKKTLVKQSAGLWGTDDQGNEFYRQYEIEQLQDSTAEQLTERVDTSLVYFFEPYVARAAKFFDQFGDLLRSDIKDKFVRFFDTQLKIEEARSPVPSATQSTRNLSEFLRKRMTRWSLDVLSRKLMAKDIALVRATIDEGFVEYSAADVAYLAKYGDWSDLPRLIAMTNRPAHRGASLLVTSSTEMYDELGKAILRLGQNRLDEVLTLKMSNPLLTTIISRAPRGEFANLRDEQLCSLMRSEDDGLRKTIALKCLNTLSKARVTRLLETYVRGDGTHYYNVIHWLDFGASMSRSVVAGALKRQLQLGITRP